MQITRYGEQIFFSAEKNDKCFLENTIHKYTVNIIHVVIICVHVFMDYFHSHVNIIYIKPIFIYPFDIDIRII